MKAIATQGTPLKTFQQEAVDNAVAILSRCLQDLEAVKKTAAYEKSRRLAAGQPISLSRMIFVKPQSGGQLLFAGILRCIVKSLLADGFSKVMLFNSHGGNIDPLAVAAREAVARQR